MGARVALGKLTTPIVADTTADQVERKREAIRGVRVFN
jgi:hypothetical protein